MSYYNNQQQNCGCYQPPRQQQCCPAYNQSYSQSYSQTYNPCCNQSYTAQPQQYCAPQQQQQSYAPPPPPPMPMPSCNTQSYAPPPPPPPQQPCPYAAARQQAQYNSNGGGGYGGQEIGPFPIDGYSPQPPQQFNTQNLNLPPPNMSCVNNPEIGQGQTRFIKHPDQTECKNIDQCFNICKTVCKDNVIHHQHNKNVIINVNRNHNHMLKVVNRDHNMHHHLINNIVKINDIHHQRIEQVRGEGRVSNDYKQVQRIEQPSCQRGNIDPINSSANLGPQQSPPTPIPQFAQQQQQQQQQNFNSQPQC